MARAFNLGSIFGDLKLDSSSLKTGLRVAENGVRTFSRRVVKAMAVATRAFRAFGGIVRRIGRSIFGLRTAIATLATGLGGLRIAKTAKDFANAEDSFTRLIAAVGEGSRVAFQKLKAASNGAIDDITLLRNANIALQLGVAKSSDEIVKFITVARRLGRITGRSAVEGFQDIVTGTARQSRLILDNLGIIISVEEANRQYAASIGKVARELTDAGEKTAFTNALFRVTGRVVRRLGEETLTFGDTLDKVLAGFRDAEIRIARRLTPSLEKLGQAFNKIFASKSFTRFLDSFAAGVGVLVEGFAGFVGQHSGAILDFFTDLSRVLSVGIQVLLRFAVAFVETIAAIINPSTRGETLARLSEGFRELGRAIGNALVDGVKAALKGTPLEKFFTAQPAVGGFFAGLLGPTNAAALGLLSKPKDGESASFARAFQNILPPGFLEGIAATQRKLAAAVDQGLLLKPSNKTVNVEDEATDKLFQQLIPLTEKQRENTIQVLEELKSINQARGDQVLGTANAIGQDIATGIFNALQSGTSVTQNIGSLLAGRFLDEVNRGISTVFTELSKNLSESLGGALGKFSGAFAGILNAAVGIAGLVLSQQKDSTVTDLPIDEVATSSAAVRGVVAGPTNVAIAEVGVSLREANRGVEALLRDILFELQGIGTNDGLSPSGLSAGTP